MNTYELRFRNDVYSPPQTEVAQTASKAKYQYYKYLSDEYNCEWEEGFLGYLKAIRIKRTHKFMISDLFEDQERFDRMKKSRGIEFTHMGQKVEVNGKSGIIIGSTSGFNLSVCLDGDFHGSNCHPYWRTKYIDNDGVTIREYGD